MFTRSHVAQFLQGLIVLPLCILFGGLTALLFGWQQGKQALCIVVFALVPLVGAIKTRQGALTAGLVTGSVLSALAYAVLRQPV